jgi:HD-like signal output (HDOD) protein
VCCPRKRAAWIRSGLHITELYIAIAGLLGGLAIALVLRRYRQASEPFPAVTARDSLPASKPRADAAPNTATVERANNLLTERLWKLAFAAPSQLQFLEPEHVQIRDSVTAMLSAQVLDPKYFPRRPTLMPQLLRAVDDPRAATERLSRIIAHDPVLASDVLRLANSAQYRISSAPIETIQRAIVVLGVEALRGLVASAMLQPIFRATRSNFPRFPRMLWERTDRATRAAEMYALETHPQDRFEAQLAVLLSALGPLVVYGVTLDAYSGNPKIEPSPTLCVALTAALGPQVSVRIARHWETSPRLLAAIEKSPQESLTTALCVGELLATLSMLQLQNVLSREEAFAAAEDAGLRAALIEPIWARLTSE